MHVYKKERQSERKEGRNGKGGREAERCGTEAYSKKTWSSI